MSESFARETINQLMEHCGPEKTFADTERKLRQKIERLEAALREIAGNGNAAGRNPQLMADIARAALKGDDHE